MRQSPDRYDLEVLDRNFAHFMPEIVYQAIYVPKGETPPTRDILKKAELHKYYDQWGRKGDLGLVAIHRKSEIPVGGAFVRHYHPQEAGYGFVGAQYPELSIALLPDHRSKGLGSQLLKTLLTALKEAGCAGISLSVDERNPAIALYRRFGFEVVKEEGNPTMLLVFS